MGGHRVFGLSRGPGVQVCGGWSSTVRWTLRTKATGVRGWRQGFLCNITNPKVLVFYLAVLPQFLGEHAPLWALIALALTHAVLSVVYLMALVHGLHAARRILVRRRVRRALDAVTGIALFGFGMRLATE